MKKILILLFAIVLSGAGYSQFYTLYINGYVTRVENNAIVPVANHEVFITVDSTNTGFSHQSVVLTDESGYYQEEVVPPYEVGFGLVTTMTYDSCTGNFQYNRQFFALGTILPSMDFMLCDGPPYGWGCDNYFYWYPADPSGTTITFEGYLMNGQLALSYEWDFGDSTYGSGQTVSHTYEIPPNGNAIYMVSLTTTSADTNGTTCTSTSMQEVWLFNQPECYAYFYYYPDSLDVRIIHFQDMSFTNNGSMPDSWFWDFGDGNTSILQNPVHTYADTGFYTVCLTISDSMGNCTNTYCEMVFTGIFPPPPASCESYIAPQNQYGLTVEFQGWTNSMHPTEYTWEFGDGVTGTGQYVTHTYPSPGIYMVSLYTIDTTGCEWLSYMEVWVDTAWQECGNFFFYEQNDSTTFTFTGEAFFNNGTTTTNVIFNWDFGDGTYGNGQTVTHTFQPDPVGIHNVCLTTVMMMPDYDSCLAVSCQEIWILPPSFSIYGHVFLSNNQVADYAEVHLMTMDTLWQNVIEVETVSLDSAGFYSFQEVPRFNTRLYFVQAELTEASAHFGEYLPTYATSSLNWETAMPVLPLMNWPMDMYMIPGMALNYGTGTITGTVSNLGTRNMLAGVEVILMDGQMNPHIYTRSDEAGNFTFSDLPYGTYIIHAEIMGIHTNQASVTLTEAKPEIAVEIQVSGSEANVVFGINERKVSIENAGMVYPNPVTSNSAIEISMSEPTMVELRVYNQLGQLVELNAITLSRGPHRVDIGAATLEPGLYLMRIYTAAGDVITRRFIKAE